MANQNVAVFPTNIISDSDIPVVSDNAYSALSGDIDATVTSIPFTDASGFTLPCLISIENEVIKAVGPTVNNTITNCQRGFHSIAATHVSGQIGFGYIFAWHHNQTSAEIKAIETALGVNLENVIQESQAAGGDLGGSYPNPTVAKVGGATASSVATAVTKSHDKNTDTGTSSTTFQIGSNNKIKNVSGGLEVRNSSDDDYADLKVKNLTTTGTLGGDLSGSLPNPVVATVGTKSAAAIAQSITDTVAATNNNTVSTLVKRDSNGDFAARNITATLIGNASTATDLVAWPKHIRFGGNAPTIAAGSGAGTTPTLAISGYDNAGKITLTAGTTPAADSTIATVTFDTAFSAAPIVILIPANKATMNLPVSVQAFVSASSTTTFTVTSNGTGLTAAGQYVWNYIVIG